MAADTSPPCSPCTLNGRWTLVTHLRQLEVFPSSDSRCREPAVRVGSKGWNGAFEVRHSITPFLSQAPACQTCIRWKRLGRITRCFLQLGICDTILPQHLCEAPEQDHLQPAGGESSDRYSIDSLPHSIGTVVLRTDICRTYLHFGILSSTHSLLPRSVRQVI